MSLVGVKRARVWWSRHWTTVTWIVAFTGTTLLAYCMDQRRSGDSEIQAKTVAPLVVSATTQPNYQAIVDEEALSRSVTMQRVSRSRPTNQTQPTKRTVVPRQQHNSATSRKGGVPEELIEKYRIAIGSCEGDPRFIYRDHGHGNTVSGKYGVKDSTWANWGGWSRAMYAPEAKQDEWMREALRGWGTGPWLSSQSCWGPKLGVA